MLTKGDWNELSLHGLKMKPEAKVSFAFNLLSSRHNLACLTTFRYLLFHLLNSSVLQLSVSVYLKVAQKSGGRTSVMLQFEQHIFDK